MPKRTSPLEGYLRFRISPPSQEASQPPPPKRLRLTSHDDYDASYQDPRSSRRAELACVRCRKRKQKCCRSLPECTSCIAAGAPCSFPPSDKSSISVTEASELRAQIQWLTERVPATAYPQLLSPVDTISSGTTTLKERDDRDEAYASSVSLDEPDPSLQPSIQRIAYPTEIRKLPVKLNLPELGQIRPLVSAYFRHVHKAYPFLDQSQIWEELDDPTSSFYDEKESMFLLLYVLCAIGSVTLHRVGELSDETVERMAVPYTDIINSCLPDLSVNSTCILMLLTIYSVWDPNGMSPWLLTGIVGRHAIALGLNRRSKMEHGLTLQEVERRHRLFWSIFALDREIASAFGLPFSINDENINVPLPSVTIDEYASSSRLHHTGTLQMCRNAIALRDLEGKILQTIHLSNSTPTLTTNSVDRNRVMDQFQSRLDDWYANGCLLSQMEDDDISFHNTIPWLNVRYHGLLIVLYYPSRFNSYYNKEQLGDLRLSIHRFVQYSAVLLRQRHLMLHHNTINRLLITCSLLVFFTQQADAELDRQFSLQEDVSLCIEILEAFPKRWLVAKRSLAIFRALQRLLMTFTTVETSLLLLPVEQEALKNIKNDAVMLVQEVLGASSLYNELCTGPEDATPHRSARLARRGHIPFDTYSDTD